ncbi:hypothetical protein LV78_003008 [Actinosynnema pretiosum]|uniref:hypothetical protein n=1 Tax=Actinosynnema pretiosum TaxID=42197 RepID=UPI0020A545D3|nr:hypothetical protein [Actinosynnema pretiosum]MCP2095032.1 hypothetical protein [Actinosynnema pretiosum]
MDTGADELVRLYRETGAGASEERPAASSRGTTEPVRMQTSSAVDFFGLYEDFEECHAVLRDK